MCEFNLTEIQKIHFGIINHTHELAQSFYKMLGYEHTKDKCGWLFNSQHPTEQTMWEMAVLAQEDLCGHEISDMLSGLHEDGVLEWKFY